VTMVLAKQMLNDSTNIIIEKRNFIYNDESILSQRYSLIIIYEIPKI
jgi:hypothetical protein